MLTEKFASKMTFSYNLKDIIGSLKRLKKDTSEELGSNFNIFKLPKVMFWKKG